jgi:hypothetical protein
LASAILEDIFPAYGASVTISTHSCFTYRYAASFVLPISAILLSSIINSSNDFAIRSSFFNISRWPTHSQYLRLYFNPATCGATAMRYEAHQVNKRSSSYHTGNHIFHLHIKKDAGSSPAHNNVFFLATFSFR